MVMEAKPSPLVVGREFVRQYYTLLHNSPDHLHRFYNQHSSFTHGGLDPDPTKDDVLIIGQKNIHDKIQQLNFRDCHAKISYVDAQATLGDGVVVQVSGELSNDGHPMRRFTQTFVLACQSPKKYYVHNDIFRYQDMYNEDDEATPRAGDEHDTNDSNVTTASSDSSGSMIVPQNTVFYQAPANIVVNNPTIIPQFPQQALQVQAPVGQVNGVMHDEMLKNISTQTTQAPQQILQNPQATIIAQVTQTIPMAPAAASLPLPVEPVAVNLTEPVPMMNEAIQYEVDQSNDSETDMMENSKENDQNSDEPVMQLIPTPAYYPAAPKNWANLVKGGPGLSFAAAPQPDLPHAPQPQSFVAITQQQQQQAQQQQKVQSTDNFANGDRRRSNNERERRTSGSNYNSNIQDGNCSLFLGNLPTRATEDELRQMFSVFGKITELRIHNKSSQNRQVPNFGFIKFEDPASALKLQDSTPIFYPDLKDPNGQKLNVELKIRKEGGGQTPRGTATAGPNMERGRNNNPGNGMNRNGSGGRGERREERGGAGGGGGNRQFSRSDRAPLGPRNGTANGTGTTYNNTRR